MPSWCSELSRLATTRSGADLPSPGISALVAITTLSRGTDLITVANDRLGAVDGGGVDEVDAKVERERNQRHRLRYGLAGAEPQTAEAARAQSGDAHPEPRPAERGV